MKRSPIAVMIAGLFLAPTLAMAADTNVTIYGIAQAAVSVVDNGNVSQIIVEDIGSRIGFKGEEKIDNDLSAWFKIENAVGLDTAPVRGFAHREGWVGLTGKTWGTVKLGRGKSYFDLAQENFDGFNGNSTMINSLLVDNAYYRLSNVIAYETPKMGGVQVKVEYGDMEKKGNGANPYTFIGAVDYKEGPWYAVGAWEIQRDQALGQAGTSLPKGVCDGCDATNTFLGGGFTLKSGTEFKLGWRHSRWETATGPSDRRNQVIGVITQPVSDKMALHAGYTHSGDRKNANDTGGHYWALGVHFEATPRTILFSEFTQGRNDRNAGAFMETTAGQGAGERTNSAWTTGLIHVF